MIKFDELHKYHNEGDLVTLAKPRKVKFKIELEEESPYCRIRTRGFISLAKQKELIHATRLEF